MYGGHVTIEANDDVEKDEFAEDANELTSDTTRAEGRRQKEGWFDLRSLFGSRRTTTLQIADMQRIATLVDRLIAAHPSDRYLLVPASRSKRATPHLLRARFASIAWWRQGMWVGIGLGWAFSSLRGSPMQYRWLLPGALVASVSASFFLKPTINEPQHVQLLMAIEDCLDASLVLDRRIAAIMRVIKEKALLARGYRSDAPTLPPITLIERGASPSSDDTARLLREVLHTVLHRHTRCLNEMLHETPSLMKEGRRDTSTLAELNDVIEAWKTVRQKWLHAMLHVLARAVVLDEREALLAWRQMADALTSQCQVDDQTLLRVLELETEPWVRLQSLSSSSLKPAEDEVAQQRWLAWHALASASRQVQLHVHQLVETKQGWPYPGVQEATRHLQNVVAELVVEGQPSPIIQKEDGVANICHIEKEAEKEDSSTSPPEEDDSGTRDEPILYEADIVVAKAAPTARSTWTRAERIEAQKQARIKQAEGKAARDQHVQMMMELKNVLAIKEDKK